MLLKLLISFLGSFRAQGTLLGGDPLGIVYFASPKGGTKGLRRVCWKKQFFSTDSPKAKLSENVWIALNRLRPERKPILVDEKSVSK